MHVKLIETITTEICLELIKRHPSTKKVKLSGQRQQKDIIKTQTLQTSRYPQLVEVKMQDQAR